MVHRLTLSRAALRALNPLHHVHLVVATPRGLRPVGLSDLKVRIAGRFHGLRVKSLPSDLRAFADRVNRRTRGTEVLGRMARGA